MIHPLYSPPTNLEPVQKYSKKDVLLYWIAFVVVLGHLLGLWMSSLSFSTKVPEHQKVIVKTVQLNPRQQEFNPHSVKMEPQLPVEQIPVPVQQAIPEPEVKQEPVKKPAPVPQQKAQPEKKEVKKVPAPKAKPKPAPAPKPAAKKNTQAKKTEAQAPVKKEAVKKKVEAKKEPTAQEKAAKEAERIHQKEVAAAKAKQQELLAKAKANVAKIGQSRNAIASTSIASLDETSIPQQLANLQIDSLPVGSAVSGELTAKEASYRDEVGVRLKLALKFPDYGSVKIKLTLNRAGKVASVSVVSSESDKNKQYIEKTVPTLIFPAFGTRFEGASQYTFSVSLNSDH